MRNEKCFSTYFMGGLKRSPAREPRRTPQRLGVQLFPKESTDEGDYSGLVVCGTDPCRDRLKPLISDSLLSSAEGGSPFWARSRRGRAYSRAPPILNVLLAFLRISLRAPLSSKRNGSRRLVLRPQIGEEKPLLQQCSQGEVPGWCA